MNLADFKNLFFIHSTVDQAAIIAKHLEHKCFFTKGEIFYELTEDKSYEKTTGLQVQNKLPSSSPSSSSFSSPVTFKPANSSSESPSLPLGVSGLPKSALTQGNIETIDAL